MSAYIISIMSRKEKSPSIVELQTIEKQIHALLGSNKRTQQEYMNMLLSPSNNSDSKNKLETLNNVNDTILSLIDKAKVKISEIYPKGIKNQDMITLDNTKLNGIIQNMKKEDNKLKKLLRSLVSADGENNDASLQKISARFQYVFFAILSVAVVFLTMNTFNDSETNTIETVILVVAAALVMYHAGLLVF